MMGEGSGVNAMSEENKMEAKIDTAIAEGITVDTIGNFLAHLDMAEDSEKVRAMRMKLLDARAKLMN